MFYLLPFVVLFTLVFFHFRTRSGMRNRDENLVVTMILFVLFVITGVIAIFLPFGHYELSFTDTGRKIIISTIAAACCYGAITTALWLTTTKWYKYLIVSILTLGWLWAVANPLIFTDWLVNG